MNLQLLALAVLALSVLVTLHFIKHKGSDGVVTHAETVGSTVTLHRSGGLEPIHIVLPFNPRPDYGESGAIPKVPDGFPMFTNMSVAEYVQ